MDSLTESLFYVEGDLVDNYNRALEQVIGKRTALTAFHIDKRGESPEIEEELGSNYLQSGPAHRYCIIISPDQKDVGLIHEEFSFDHDVLDFLYRNYLSGISLSTRVDGLYGELNDDVREYETFEDLLLIKKIQLELHTPSGFLTKARRLQRYVRQLEYDPNLLIAHESEHLRKILDLVSEVGDVRNYDLSPIEATKELTTFFTRLFDGVCVFRDFKPRDSLQMKSPDQEPYLSQRVSDSSIAIENLPENLLLVGKEVFDLPEDADQTVAPKQETRLKTVVIYQQTEEEPPEDGPTVKFIPLQDRERVIKFLVDHGYADYSYDLLEQRLSRLEDETLLQQGCDVTEIRKEQRLQAFHHYQADMLPEWHELKDLKRKITKGHAFPDILRNYSANLKGMLLASVANHEDDSYVVNHLLTRLYDFNYEMMYTYNKRHLERLYQQADDNKRKYISHVIMKGGNVWRLKQ
jgi:hypothetical protein